MSLAIGETAPDFQAVDQHGNTHHLAQYRGQPVVLYFYPKDDTPGCTKQACSLRDGQQDLQAKGAVVLGVSTQDQESHRKFSNKHQLNFPLLDDSQGKICRDYEVLGGGSLLQKATSLLGLASRKTFIIDAQGRIAHVFDKPRTQDHAVEVLEHLPAD